MSIDPHPIRELSDRLRLPEPAEISPDRDPLRAELEFLRLCRTRPEVARFVFIFAYSELLERYVAALGPTARRRGGLVTEDDQDVWRRRLVAEWMRSVEEDEPQTGSAGPAQAFRRWLTRLFTPSNFDRHWLAKLRERGLNGERRSLRHRIDETLSEQAWRIAAEIGG